MSTHVPIPALPKHVTLTWTATRAALIVSCSACRNADALFTTLLLKDPAALATAVDDHRRCGP